MSVEPRVLTTDTALDRLYARVTWRLIPLLFCFYVFGYLDRVNVGFAKLQMLEDLGWSNQVYGFGSGVFFLSYALFGAPLSLLLPRWGAKRYIALLIVCWGAASMAMMWITTPLSFYLLRFFLGAAESGFFPGVVYYLTLWYPMRRRARVNALFMMGIPAAGIIGGPLSGWIMQNFHEVHGWAGWRWLFLLEGLPSVLLVFSIPLCLNDSIAQAKWLNDSEKDELSRQLHAEQVPSYGLSLRQILSSAAVWQLGLISCFGAVGLYAIGFWLPQVVKETGLSNFTQIGLLSAAPYLVALIVMGWVCQAADRSGRRHQSYIACVLAAAAGWLLVICCRHHLALSLLGLSLACAGSSTALPLLATIPGEFLAGPALAPGFGVINSIGILGGFCSPYVVGLLQDLTHDLSSSLWFVAGCLITAAALLHLMRPGWVRAAAAAALATEAEK